MVAEIVLLSNYELWGNVVRILSLQLEGASWN